MTAVPPTPPPRPAPIRPFGEPAPRPGPAAPVPADRGEILSLSLDGFVVEWQLGGAEGGER